MCIRDSSPTMATGIALFWMKSTMRSKTSSRSVSKPRMNPPITSMQMCIRDRTVATQYRHCVGTAMTLAVMGYHFHVMTERLLEQE